MSVDPMLQGLANPFNMHAVTRKSVRGPLGCNVELRLTLILRHQNLGHILRRQIRPPGTSGTEDALLWRPWWRRILTDHVTRCRGEREREPTCATAAGRKN